MTKDRFLTLARQFFVPIPDPDAEVRSRIHAHIGECLFQMRKRVNAEIEAERERHWIAYDNGSDYLPPMRLPHIPSLSELEAAAYETWEGK